MSQHKNECVCREEDITYTMDITGDKLGTGIMFALICLHIIILYLRVSKIEKQLRDISPSGGPAPFIAM